MITKSRLLLLAGLMVVAFASQQANADILASYDFTGGDGDSGGQVIESAPGIFSAEGGNNTGISSGNENAYIFTSTTADFKVDALDGDYYFTFTVNPATASDKLDLTTLTLDCWGQGASATLYIQSDVDGFGSSFDTIPTTDTGDASALDGTETSYTYDLSAAKFKGLDSIELRMYFSDDDNSSKNTLRVDNVELTGTVVPEPATMSLLALGGLALLRRRRMA